MSDAFFNYLPFYTFASGIANLSRFVEVGVYAGASITYLAKQLVARGTPFELYAVDLWDQVNTETDYDRTVEITVWNAFMARIEHEGVSGHIRILKKESSHAAANFDDGSLDFVFIDANHTYEHVLADIKTWMPKMKPGGLFSGHDYGEPCGVKQAVDELLGDKISLMGTCWYTFIK